MEGLDFNNILGADEVDTLFSEPEETPAQEERSSGGKPESEHDDTNRTTEAVDPESLFGEEPEEKKEEEKEEEKQPESVGSEETDEEQGDATTEENSGTSPNENFYSSIANACAVDGIFPNLDDEKIKEVNDAESFSDLIEAEVNARLDEKQQRISKALENGVEPTDIRRYENTLNFIQSIKDSDLTAEDEKGEQLRRNLIYQDYINKGYSAERAQKMTQRAIDNGTDIEDAKDALQGNKEFFQNAYDKLLEDAEKEAEAEKVERKKQSEKLKDAILKDKTLMGDMEVAQDIRKKTLENISRPVYRDPETGEYLTALQKYETEHRADFLKYVGLFYTLTGGFKDFKSFTKGQVKKEVKKGLRELEQQLSNTRRSTDGSLKMVTTVKDDPESYLGEGFRLDI